MILTGSRQSDSWLSTIGPVALADRSGGSFESVYANHEELDKTMLNDGIDHHENIKVDLLEYSINNNEKK